MKVGLILCKCFITYPNSVSVLISFVFSSWIINQFEIIVYIQNDFLNDVTVISIYDKMSSHNLNEIKAK